MPASPLPPTGTALDRVIRRITVTSASMAVLGPALLSIVNIGPLMLVAAVIAVLPAIALARGRPVMVTA